MKIAILGTSGSGKSTLAQTLGATYHAPVLHLDTVHFLPGWVERPLDEENAIVRRFLDTHESWIIDGNYTKTCYDRRLEEADQIIVLCFGRFTCLSRVLKRWWKNRERCAPPPRRAVRKNRCGVPMVGPASGPDPAKLAGYRRIGQQYPEKFVFLKNQSQLERFLSSGSYSL